MEVVVRIDYLLRGGGGGGRGGSGSGEPSH
jgi:hypothetical protein